MTKTRSARIKGTSPCEKETKKQDKMFFVIAVVLFITALVFMIHQWVAWPGHWWDTEQILHHESFAILFVAIGLGLLIARYAVRRKR